MSAPSPRLDLNKIGQLTFENPDESRFPALRMARESLDAGASAPTILNAANEIAVRKFLDGEIGFLDICQIVEQTLEKVDNISINSLEDVFSVDKIARHTAERLG